MDLYNIYTEEKLVKAERDKLKDKDFGIPELRQYPLVDEEHTKKAIQLFNKADEKYKKKLAFKIYEASLLYNVEISTDSAVYKYLDKDKQHNVSTGKKALSENGITINDNINYQKLSLNEDTINMYKESFHELNKLTIDNKSGLMIVDSNAVVGYVFYNEATNYIDEIVINPVYESVGILPELMSYNKINESTKIRVDKDDIWLNEELPKYGFSLIKETVNFNYYSKSSEILNESVNEQITSVFNEEMVKTLNEDISAKCKELANECCVAGVAAPAQLSGTTIRKYATGVDLDDYLNDTDVDENDE
jgi:hypothetical protein